MLVNFRILAGILAALAVMNASAAPVPADCARVEKELAAAAAKLRGTWVGGPCEGSISFRADGTYEWTGRGPVADGETGVWVLRGDPTRPTLVMLCKEADNPDREGKTLEVSLVRIGDKELVFKYADEEQPKTYPRRKVVTGPN
jgi:hypothetical protein